MTDRNLWISDAVTCQRFHSAFTPYVLLVFLVINVSAHSVSVPANSVSGSTAQALRQCFPHILFVFSMHSVSVSTHSISVSCTFIQCFLDIQLVFPIYSVSVPALSISVSCTFCQCFSTIYQGSLNMSRLNVHNITQSISSLTSRLSVPGIDVMRRSIERLSNILFKPKAPQLKRELSLVASVNLIVNGTIGEQFNYLIQFVSECRFQGRVSWIVKICIVCIRFVPLIGI